MDSSTTTNSFSDSYREQLHSFCLPNKLTGSYHICNCLKQASHKEIYLLSDEQEKHYILKRGTGNQIPLLKQEYQIMKQLAVIPGLAIPQYIHCWEEDNFCYLLRHYIEGCSLAAYFEKRLYFTDLEIVNFMLEICHLIQILHSQNPPIIHRDIKPENFVIQKGSGTLYLIDFDTARQFTPDKSRDTTLMGTPSHAAPEQFGFSQSDIRTDIYALGKTMLFIASGTTEDKDLHKLSITTPLRKIIEHCISFSPEQRYPDIVTLIKALEKYKHRLLHRTFSKKQLLMIALIPLVGITAFLGGHYTARLQNPTSHMDNMPAKNNSADSVTNNDNPDTNTSDIINAGNGSAEESIKAQSNGSPLLEQSGKQAFDITKYRNSANQIILDYYNDDKESLALHCESLVAALYKDDALIQIPGTDYSENDIITKEELAVPSTTHLRNSLAYRNRILYKRLGSYQNYENYIFLQFYSLLNKATTNTENGLYQYASAAGTDADDKYEQALVDIVCSIRYGFDMADSYPSPIEEYE